jgi:hypothetical protein
MKIPALLLLALSCWVAAWKAGGELAEGMTEQRWETGAILLALALLISLFVTFARAGRIRFEEDRLTVSTPLGFAKIPYSSIETIRRCRRKGRAQQLQIIFGSPGERKMLRIRPGKPVEFAARLRGKCPHLSSSSDVVLVRRNGEGEIIHSALA